MIRVGHATISVCCELPYASTGQSTRRRHADSARPGWSDTRRRISGSFARTSQAFARFNSEIRIVPLSSQSIVCSTHRDRQTRGGLPYLIVLLPRDHFADASSDCSLQGTWQLLATLAEALYQMRLLVTDPTGCDDGKPDARETWLGRVEGTGVNANARSGAACRVAAFEPASAPWLLPASRRVWV